MKVTYELDTENDDRTSFERLNKSLEMALALEKFSNRIRNWRKYDERESIPVEEISNEFYETLEEYGLDLDNLLE